MYERAAIAVHVQILNQASEVRECFSKGRLRKTCCISQYSLGVNFTDSDAGIYTKCVRDMRVFNISREIVDNLQLTQYSSSQSYFQDIRAVYNHRYAQN